MRNRQVDVGRARHPLVEQRPGLVKQRSLEPVEDEAFDLLAHDDGRLPHRLHLLSQPGDSFGVRPWRRHQLDQRDQVRRIDGMGDQETRPIGAGFGEGRGGNAGAGAAHDGVRPHRPADLLADGFLDVAQLKNRLLHIVGISDRTLQRIGHAQPLHDRIDGIDQPGLQHVGKAGTYPLQHRCADLGAAVIDRYVTAGPGKDDRPAAADKAGPDDGDLADRIHHCTCDVSPSARQISVMRRPSLVMRDGNRSLSRSSWMGMTRRAS